MKKMLALLILLGLGLCSAQDRPTLNISLTELTDVEFLRWVDDPCPGGTGCGHYESFQYTGPAIRLWSEDLPDLPKGGLIECSTNLIDWHGYPSDGVTLTLIQTNNSVMTLCDQPYLFFRLRVQTLNFGL